MFAFIFRRFAGIAVICILGNYFAVYCRKAIEIVVIVPYGRFSRKLLGVYMQLSFFGANARSANRLPAERRTFVILVRYVRTKIQIGVGIWHFAFETQIAVIVVIVDSGGVAYLVVLAHKPLFAVVLVRYYFAVLGDFRNIAVCVVFVRILGCILACAAGNSVGCGNFFYEIFGASVRFLRVLVFVAYDSRTIAFRRTNFILGETPYIVVMRSVFAYGISLQTAYLDLAYAVVGITQSRRIRFVFIIVRQN